MDRYRANRSFSIGTRTITDNFQADIAERILKVIGTNPARLNSESLVELKDIPLKDFELLIKIALNTAYDQGRDDEALLNSEDDEDS